MPGFNPNHAKVKGEELLEAVRNGSTVAKLSASIGFAIFRPGDTLETFLKRADERLYKAKAGGRDRFVGEEDDI